MSSLISVILPIYNAEKYVLEAVNSILEQTYTNFELLLLDDGSTDNSLKIIESIKDSRIKIIKNKTNLGLIETLNKGFSLAKGEYIARMDADDISLPERFEKQINYFKEFPNTDILGTQYEIFGHESGTSKLNTNSKQIEIELYFKNIICHPSVMMKTSSIRNQNLKFEKQYLHNEDWAFWFNAIKKGLKIVNLDLVLLKYRAEGQNITIKNIASATARHQKLYTYFLNDVFNDFNSKTIKLHQEISNPLKVSSDTNSILNYLRKFEKILNNKGYSKKDIKQVFTKKKTQLFYKITDYKKTQGFIFLIKSKLINLRYLRYLIASFK